MKILITRPLLSSIDLINKLKRLGIKSWMMPLYEFLPSEDLINLPKKISLLKTGDLLFIVSKNSVFFIEKFFHTKKIIWPVNLNYYSIGYNTAKKFQKVSKCFVKYPNEEETSEGLIKLLDFNKLKEKKALILCGNNRRNYLSDILIKNKIKVIFCECYKTIKKNIIIFCKGYFGKKLE